MTPIWNWNNLLNVLCGFANVSGVSREVKSAESIGNTDRIAKLVFGVLPKDHKSARPAIQAQTMLAAGIVGQDPIVGNGEIANTHI